MQLLLFNFAKRQNSLAVPADSAGTAIDVLLKSETSLNNPIFTVSGAIPDATYCKFNGAYYFINDIRSIRNNLYEIIATIDILGTYRSNINATNAYVEFASDGYADMMDKRIVPRSPVTQSIASGNIGISQTGCYILSVVGKDGCVQYVCNLVTLQNILTSVENWAIGTLSSAVSEIDALKIGFSQLISQGSALDAVRSCRWVPFDASFIPTSNKRMYLGNYDTGINAEAVTTLIKTFGVQITVPFNRTGWLRLRPYTDVFLYLPFVGVVNINNAYFQSNNELTINVSVNVVSGEIAYSVMIDSVIIGTYGGNCGASIDFGTTITPALQIGNGIFQAASAMGIVSVSGGGAALASIGAANTIIDAAQGALTPVQSCVGGIQGGVGAGLVTSAVVYVLEHDISGAVGNMATVQGLPYFKTELLGNLQGYVQTSGASVSGNIRGDLRQRINAMLDSGVFMG